MTEPTTAEVADLLFRASRELRAARRSKLAAECQSLAGRLQHAAAPSSAELLDALASVDEAVHMPCCSVCTGEAWKRAHVLLYPGAAYQPPAERLAAMDAGGAL